MKTQFVLPEQITDQVITQIHSSLYNAHLGRKKTTSKITERLYRPLLAERVKECLKRCDTCQKIKKTEKEHRAQLIYLKPYRTNQLITTDLAGPFKISVRGNKYLLIIICHFSKYMQEFAIPNIQAETVADKIVNNWCCVFGIPESILADGGKQYQSKLLDLVYEYLDIRGLKTTPFNPRCNGLSEKSVQTSKNMIKAHVNDEQSDWDEHLVKFTYAYNTSVQETTKQTPFEMMFGRKPKLPIDIATFYILPNVEIPREINSEEHNQSDHDVGEVTILNNQERIKIPEEAQSYLDKLKRTMEESHSKAALNRNSAMDKHKLFYDRRIKKFSYKIGDYVLCDHPRIKKGVARGLEKKYYGPFQ